MELNNSDRDFEVWLKFFDKKEPSLTKFFSLLNKKDTYFVNHPLELDFEDELYEKIMPGGFIEKDFQDVLANENPKEFYYKTRIAIAMSKGMDFSLIRNRIGDKNFYSVLEKVLIDGHYEEYDLHFEKLVAMAIGKYALPRTSLVDISFLRGVNLGSRYDTSEKEDELKKKVFKNKVKIKAGI
jgi:hypothetical protein